MHTADQSGTRPILSLAALTSLKKAMKNARTRAAVVKDPVAYLAGEGHKLPGGAGAEILTRSAKPLAQAHAIEARIDRGDLTVRPAWPGLEAWWSATHGGCPLGTFPYTSKRKETVCDAYVMTYSGKEWVPRGSAPFGRWEYQNVKTVCILSHEVEVEVTECLPGVVVPE